MKTRPLTDKEHQELVDFTKTDSFSKEKVELVSMLLKAVGFQADAGLASTIEDRDKLFKKADKIMLNALKQIRKWKHI